MGQWTQSLRLTEHKEPNLPTLHTTQTIATLRCVSREHKAAFLTQQLCRHTEYLLPRVNKFRDLGWT